MGFSNSIEDKKLDELHEDFKRVHNDFIEEYGLAAQKFDNVRLGMRSCLISFLIMIVLSIVYFILGAALLLILTFIFAWCSADKRRIFENNAKEYNDKWHKWIEENQIKRDQ
ncbi:hypothetical protein [Paenibacillus naphthalenovorans]|uniref:hypothetical protein n=1 Tax=Paenibacillus naphthalenovorans TaxID=162209 RepID=UPI003D2BF36E